MLKSLLIVLSIFLAIPAYSQLLEVEQKTISLYKEVLPSVVNVSNIKVARNFFEGTVEIPQGAGSGFVWDKSGHIVTNFHVVHGGNDFVVTFHNDPKQYHAKLVGTEPKKDIAVLKLNESPATLSPIKVGSSKSLQVGQMTLAIGSPFGLDHTLTTGIVSALGRKIDGFGGVKIHDMIQTDAAINMGNSGGPLLNSSGQLIGMNTMIFSTSGSSAGLGFAVPVDTVSYIVPQLIKYQRVIRPGLGIGIMPEIARERLGIKSKGVILSFVDEKGAAGKAGLKGMTQDRRGRMYLGDVILSVDGKEVNNLDDIFHVLEGYKIGDVVVLKYQREDKTLEVKVKLQSL
ncbi:MAG: trypsin-like peptidase domain-containing protein [Bacteriovoracaceae bacterium]|nr:trypsin-like peptidase domain-containing protein [Bacteriovoracaceae bacterium]